MRFARWLKRKPAELEDLPWQERYAMLESRMLLLEGQFATLQGYVYATRKRERATERAAMAADNHAAQPAAAPSSAGDVTKDELRRQLGLTGRIMPGRPTKM